MRQYTAQTRFIAGELSPRMHMQMDNEFYKFGAAKVLNMVVTEQGTLKRRDGTEHIQSYTGAYARVLPFQLSPNSPVAAPFPVVVSDNGQMYVEGSFGYTIGTPVNTNPYFDLGNTGWTTSGYGTANFVTGSVVITASTTSGQDLLITQAISITVAGQYVLKALYESYSTPSPEVQILVGTTAGANDITTYFLDGEYTAFDIASPATVYVTFKVLGGYYIETPDEGKPPTGTQLVYLDSIEVRKRTLATSSSSVAHPYNQDDLVNLRYAMVPAQNAMYLVTPKKAPMRLFFNTGTTSWELSVISFTGAPTEWTTGNYPRCMCFFQGRSWWSGVESDPETIWGSKSLVFDNLTVGPTASDAIKFTNSTKGRIEWLAGVRNLLVGTEFGEYIVTSQSGVIQPSDLAIAPQSADGGCSISAMPIGTAALFVSADRKKIKTARYTWTDESWVTADKTSHAEHMFESGIVELAYARNPDSLLWVVLADGTLASATVSSFDQPLAWHRHDIGNRVVSCCVLQERGVSTIYLVTYRGGSLALERMSPAIALDSFKAKSSTSAFSTMTGLNNLKNLTVSAQLDGFYYDNVTVNSSGEAVLPIECKQAYIGLPFSSELQPLKMDYAMGAGSTATLTRTNGVVDIWVIDSYRPKINGYMLNSRSSETSADLPEPTYTGRLTYSLKGYNNADMTIQSVGSYGLEICGVFVKGEGSTL